MFRARGLSFFNQRILNVDFNRRGGEGRKEEQEGGGGEFMGREGILVSIEGEWKEGRVQW